MSTETDRWGEELVTAQGTLECQERRGKKNLGLMVKITVKIEKKYTPNNLKESYVIFK